MSVLIKNDKKRRAGMNEWIIDILYQYFGDEISNAVEKSNGRLVVCLADGTCANIGIEK